MPRRPPSRDGGMNQFNFRSRKVETLAFRRDFARHTVDYDPENLWDRSWGGCAYAAGTFVIAARGAVSSSRSRLRTDAGANGRPSSLK